MPSSSTEHLTPSIRLQREFEQECVQLFGEVVTVLGVPRSVGQIYGLLFASPRQALSFSDIVERLEISKGSASQGLQLLRTLGAIRPAATERSGVAVRDYYEPELGLRKLVSGILQEQVAPLATAGADRLVRLRLLAERDEEKSGFYLDRVKQLEIWRRRLRNVLPVISALLGPIRKKG